MESAVQRAMSSGLGLGVFFSVNFLVGMITVPYLGTFLQVLMFVLVIRATRNYLGYFRHTRQREEFGFWEGYGFVVMLYFFASIIACGVKIVCLKWIFPDYLPHMLEETNKVLSDPAFAQLEGFSDTKAALAQVMTPVNYSLYWIWIDTVLGALVGVPMALWFKRRSVGNGINE